jgi:hypothetical protein
LVWYEATWDIVQDVVIEEDELGEEEAEAWFGGLVWSVF